MRQRGRIGSFPVEAFTEFENDPKFNLGNYGYTLRRAKGKGASGFIAYKNEKPDTAQTPSSEVEEPRRWTTFDDRKTAAEAKFTHDQEFQFKTIARRNKLLGLWAADQMGISGVDAEAYAKQVVIADFEEPGDADVLRKVLGDLTDKGIATDEHKVRYEMTRLLEEAKTQVSIE